LREDWRSGRELTFHTSGSTGTPIASIWKPDEFRESVAVREVRSLNWAGVSYKMPRATFSGRMVEPDPTSSGPFHRFNFVERQVYLSPFHLSRETAPRYIEALQAHKTAWLTGYAVSFYLLAEFMLDLGIEPPSTLKAVITTSEKLTPEMRCVMQRAYGCKIWEEYSTVENSLFVSECEQGRLHSSPDVAIVEILRPDGVACEPGEEGEVVTTCVMRPYQPFIRYRLGDVAAWDPEPCPCGREMPVIKEVCGRIEEVVIGPDGRQMVRFHGIFVDLPAVREGQILQEEIDRIRVRIVPARSFSEETKREIESRIHQRLGPSVSVIVETVDQIARTKAGKFQAVVSLLKNKGESRSVSKLLCSESHPQCVRVRLPATSVARYNEGAQR
jgi:phenylacetate-CoA ligase